MQDFRKLKVWQRAQDFAVRIYEVTKSMPESERDLTVDQLRRASSAIGDAIAEGAGKGTRRDFARYLMNGVGSVSEVESRLNLAMRVQLLSNTEADALTDEAAAIRRMLVALHKKVLKGR